MILTKVALSLPILQGIKSTELKAVVNVVLSQLEKYGKDVDTLVFYLGQVVMKKCCNMQSVHIAMTRSQPLKKWWPSWGGLSLRSTPRQSGILYLEKRRCR